jgi:hypothetical protein
VIDEILRNEISPNFYVCFAKVHKILYREISKILRNFSKFHEIFATKFCFLLDEAKNNVAETEQEIAADLTNSVADLTNSVADLTNSDADLTNSVC